MLYVECVSFFFFKQKTAYEMRISDWSSDVCSSDLTVAHACLRGEVDDPADAVRFHQLADQPGAGDVAVDQPEIEMIGKPRRARFLQRDVIIVGEAVEPDHALAAREQPFGHRMADEARGAGHQYGAVVGHAARL